MERYQRDKGLGFTPGQTDFDRVWANAYDDLRFHGGDGFVIIEQMDQGPKRTLREIPHFLGARLAVAPLDRIFVVKSLRDGYLVKFRRHEVTSPKGQLVIQHAADLVGTPYVLGGCDCSWLSMTCVGKEGVDLPHNAHAQRLDPQVVAITRAQIQPGDLLFHHFDDHVSIYLDDQNGGRVWDTEPHDAPNPNNVGTLGTGVRIRPMISGYYCDWEHVNGIGRIVAINGAP